MTIQEVSSSRSVIVDHEPSDLAEAVLELTVLTSHAYYQEAARRALDMVRQGELPRLMIAWSFLDYSMGGEGVQHCLDIRIYQRECLVTCHRGSSPGVGPMQQVAEFIDSRAGSMEF